MSIGVYPDKGIEKLIQEGIISSENKIEENQIQPSSLDLRLGDIGFCIPYESFPLKNNSKKLEDYFKSISHYELDFGKNNFLHHGKIYAIKLQERLSLPEGLKAKSNPKSSIGRTDIHVKLITENGVSFDKVSQNYKGDLWLQIISGSFDIKVSPGLSLNQIRFSDISANESDNNELKSIHRKWGILYDYFNSNNFKKVGMKSIEKYIKDRKISIGINISENLPKGIVGYIAKKNIPHPVDLSKRDHSIEEYFDIIPFSKKGIIINPSDFCILSSYEIVNIPKGYCAEVVDIDTSSGEFRTHYAGFFDPGFKAQAVLEVRNFGIAPILLRHKQRIANLEFSQLEELPKRVYGGKKIKSTYQNQNGPKLSKFFVEKK